MKAGRRTLNYNVVNYYVVIPGQFQDEISLIRTMHIDFFYGCINIGECINSSLNGGIGLPTVKCNLVHRFNCINTLH